LLTDNPVLLRIRRLSMEDQLDMWAWHSGKKGSESGVGSMSGSKEQPPTRSPYPKGEPGAVSVSRERRF
jgi:hypothetical protein